MSKLILLRHGQRQWKLENRFTGWKDVPLTKKGVEEAINAGKIMKKNIVLIDKVYSSVLQRANQTGFMQYLKWNQIIFIYGMKIMN